MVLHINKGEIKMIIKHEIRAAFESILDILEIHETDWESVSEETKSHIFETISLNCSDYRCTTNFVRKVVERSFIDMNDPSDPEYYPSYQWNHLMDREIEKLLKEAETEVVETLLAALEV